MCQIGGLRGSILLHQSLAHIERSSDLDRVHLSLQQLHLLERLDIPITGLLGMLSHPCNVRCWDVPEKLLDDEHIPEVSGDR
jgi:hypothetical protein